MSRSIILVLALLLSSASKAARLEVEIKNTQGKGKITCGLYENKEGFPSDSKKAKFVVDGLRNDATKAVCKFVDVANGTYAVSAREDVNENGKMDTTFVGFPKEPWGVSNDAPMHTFGPPEFQEAAFKIENDKTISIQLNRK